MPNPLFRARVFWLISRMGHAIYGRFPILGRIRGSVAVIRREGGYLVIRRNDGLGLGFPGGIARRKEPPEQAVRREVREETGLSVERAELLFDFRLDKPFPVHTFVFEVNTKGELRESWEGVPVVVGLEELEKGIVVSQRPIVSYLRSNGAALA